MAGLEKMRVFWEQLQRFYFAILMAGYTRWPLAGTARSEEQRLFAVDDKEIREHEFVAQTLIAKLSDLGMVVRRVRDILDLGRLIHFQTLINVELYQYQETQTLIEPLASNASSRSFASDSGNYCSTQRLA
jgi:hypothetical protein